MSQFVPTEEQKKALESPTPLLALAGAGTGKTTVLTHRIADTILNGRGRADQILALTFTDKAATEMAERLTTVLAEKGLAGKAREVTVRTFHSFGQMVIEENLLQLGFDSRPRVMDGAVSWQLMASIFNDLSFDAIEIAGSPGEFFNHLLHFISQCKDHLVGPNELESYGLMLDGSPAEYVTIKANQLRELAAVYRRYETAKREKGLLDFGDLLYLPVKLFEDNLSVRDSYRRRFRFLFVDEYQDTNHSQRLLLLGLLDPANPDIMVIGDDDQAIYRWRGAVVYNILNFPNEQVFAEGKVARAPITLNRRSLPPILDLANIAISRVGQRHAKYLDYHETNKQGQGLVGNFVAADDVGEAEWIAAKIKELEPEARNLAGKKQGYGAFAILCRKRALFETIGEALDRAQIPYELVGGTGFYGRWEIRDILSYLRVLADRGDDLAVARILLSPRFRLHSREMFHLGNWVHVQNGDHGREDEGLTGEARFHLLDAVLNHSQVAGLSQSAHSRLAALRGELEDYEPLSQRLPLSELLTHIIENTGYRRELLAQTGFDAKMALLNLAKLEEMSRQFEAAAEVTRVTDFVEFVGFAVESGEDEGEVRPLDEETNTVKVMTVHQAKGLEFPIVFIPGLADGTFPKKPRYEGDKWWELPWALRGDSEHLPPLDLTSASSDKHFEAITKVHKEAERLLQLDEERRLFYVAITRAQNQLYLSRAHWYGLRKTRSEPSEFWDLVVESGLSVNMGEEASPQENPNLSMSEAAEASANDKEAQTANPEALLLSEEQTEAWLEATAQQVGMELWKVRQSEVDAHLAKVASTLPLPLAPKKTDISCSGLIRYLDCPLNYRFIYVNRLPAPPSPSAQLGLEVHRRLEELSGATDLTVTGPMDEEALGEADVDDIEITIGRATGTAREPATIAGMLACFGESPYAHRSATYIEFPFHLVVKGGVLHGRIDRLDRLTDGRWEVIDFKSGVPHSEAPTDYWRQLALYALAVRETFNIRAGQISTHLFFLQDGTDLTINFDDAELDTVRDEAEAAIQCIAQGEFPKATDEQACDWCNYRHLCYVGRGREDWGQGTGVGGRGARGLGG